MATTTNFGWETPDDTDLVKDGALAMRTLGNAIDTSLVDLKGGTTGQVLSKTSNTDMDFTWVTSDDANAIQNAIVDAKGDLITATAADTPARLAVGTNGQVLTADSTTATGLKWAAAAAGGKVLQVVSGTYSTPTTVASTTYTDTGLSLSITPTAATSKILILVAQHYSFARSGYDQGTALRLLRGSTSIFEPSGTGLTDYQNATGSTATSAYRLAPLTYLDSPATTSAITYKTQGKVDSTSSSGTSTYQLSNGISTITLLEIGA
jgi:hypothetical protein